LGLNLVVIVFWEAVLFFLCLGSMGNFVETTCKCSGDRTEEPVSKARKSMSGVSVDDERSSQDHIYQQGYLLKQPSSSFKPKTEEVRLSTLQDGWKKRWFVFNRVSVTYFEDRHACESHKPPLGVHNVSDDHKFAIRDVAAEDLGWTENALSPEQRQELELLFAVIGTEQSLLVRAESAADKSAWLLAMNAYVQDMASLNAKLREPGETRENGGGEKASSEPESTKPPSSELRRASVGTGEPVPDDEMQQIEETILEQYYHLPSEVQKVAKEILTIEREFTHASERALATGTGKRLNGRLKALKPTLIEYKKQYSQDLAIRDIVAKFNSLLAVVPQRSNDAITKFNALRLSRQESVTASAPNS